MRNVKFATLLCLVVLTTLGNDAKAQKKCALSGEWQLTDAGTKDNGRVLFAMSDGKLTATYKGTGPTPTDQNYAWKLSKIYCDQWDDFITFQVQSWGDFWFFRKETDGLVKWIGRFRRDNEEGVSEAVFFPLNKPPSEQILSFSLPPQHVDQLHGVDIWATNYYVYLANIGNDIPLLDMADHALGPVLSSKDWCLGSIEGTIKVGSTTYNFDGTKLPTQVDCKKVVGVSVGPDRYRKARGPFGDGAQGFGLVPWRSLASDPKLVPTGTVLFVPAAVGTKLPDGRTHDGYFFVADVGSRVNGNHVDVFTGDSKNPIFEFVTSDNNKQVKAFIVTEPDLIQGFSDLHMRWIFDAH